MTEQRRLLTHKLYLLALAILVVAGLAMAWSWTPMRDWLDVDLVVSSLRRFGHQFGPLAAVCGFALALTVAIPLTFLTLVALAAYGPAAGFACAVTGALMSAAVSYGAGAFLGREVVQSLGGERVNTWAAFFRGDGLRALTNAAPGLRLVLRPADGMRHPWNLIHKAQA